MYGHRWDLSNPFHWDHVVLNLPGSRGYRADLPWVMKLRADGFLAAEIFVYVDDGRVVAYLPDLAWRAARAYAACCARLVVQDASRKRTLPSEMPGPRAGTVTHTNGGQVCGMVSQEMWEKKLLIRELSRMLEQDFLPLQRLLVIRGFLIYVVCTYPWLNPYVKGHRLLEARQGGIRLQDEGEGIGTSTSRLGREPGSAVPTGGRQGGRRHR